MKLPFCCGFSSLVSESVSRFGLPNLLLTSSFTMSLMKSAESSSFTLFPRFRFCLEGVFRSSSSELESCCFLDTSFSSSSSSSFFSSSICFLERFRPGTTGEVMDLSPVSKEKKKRNKYELVENG